ncbi:MAG TPA: helicase-exonuclease AddAB subunit AddB [Candidatus Merdenecus merdavium]|nr:helicase-exonuclease AddAB subunit AddB [Candidatus Merdenecus merdavium]
MSLQIVYGSSGAGKSYEIYKKVIEESMTYPKKNYIIIVPEQFTMQTQKDLVSMHPRKGIMNIDILSFGRLAYRVFEEVGADERTVLEESGKSLVLRKIAGDKKKDLPIFGSNLKKLGYIGEVKSILSELTQYNISLEDLDHMIQVSKDHSTLQYKLKDIRVLYQAFKDYLSDHYITEEEILDVLCQVVSKSKLIENSEIILDGFTGFTPIQNKLLRELLKLAKKITISLTLDPAEEPFRIYGEHELFYLTKKTIRNLMNLAKEEQVTIEEPHIYGKDMVYRFKDAHGLGFLEKNLFRYHGKTYDQEQDEISIHLEKNPMGEAYFIARNIRSLVREHHYRYKDIAVITGDMESYSNYIEKAFLEYDIPCFIDHKRTILMNPFIEYIRALLDIVILDFSYESMFRFLRCDLTGIPLSDIDILENYVIAFGIRGHKKWEKPWTRNFKREEEGKLVRINEIREEVATPLLLFAKVLKNKNVTVKEITEALYHMIVSHGIQKKLKEYEIAFMEEGNKSLAKEYSQVYKIVMDLFDQVVKLLGEENISITEYKEMLEAGFQETKVGIIPPGVDQIMVGDIERTRLKDVKVLFFAGINDGNIPKSVNQGGIISEMEREILNSHKIELAPTARQNSYIQKFYLYLNMTKPSERLYLSYSKMNSEGKALRPSYLISTIKKLFPAITVVDEEVDTGLLDRVVTYKSGIPYLIDGLQDYKEGKAKEEWWELFLCYLEHENYQVKLNQLMDATFLHRNNEQLSKTVANALYGKVLENSVTRLERYAACAFAHFMGYGLKLSERKTYTFEPVDMGNILHHILEDFSKQLEHSSYDWFTLPDDKREEMVEFSLDKIITDDDKAVLHSSARNEYMITRIRRIVKRTIWGLQEQIKRGSFTPKSYEVSFAMAENLESLNIALSKDESLKLKGRIDRLDTYETEDTLYIKIIDYKSGNTSFDMVELYYGLQLQLVVYLNAAVEMNKQDYPNKEVVPGGILYYNMKDPMTEKEEQVDSEEEIKQKILKELRMSGLVNSDIEVIQHLDKTMEKSSKVIPVTLNKEGFPTKTSSVASKEQFEVLSNYVNDKISKIGKEILNGNMNVEPYELGTKNSCEYCQYKKICGFDPQIPGYKFRRFRKYKPEDVWKKIQEESPLHLGDSENKDEEVE